MTAQVSLRIVPDQSLDAVCNSLVQHLRTSFDALFSANSIKVRFGFFARPSIIPWVLLAECFLIGHSRAYGRLMIGRSGASVVPGARAQSRCAYSKAVYVPEFRFFIHQLPLMRLYNDVVDNLRAVFLRKHSDDWRGIYPWANAPLPFPESE